MAQYIPKAALVAEIEKLVKDAELYLKYNSDDDSLYEMYKHQKAMMLDLLNKVDAFEVKEVDLEKEISKYIAYNICPPSDKVKKIAKHFFELGIKAVQKGE